MSLPLSSIRTHSLTKKGHFNNKKFSKNQNIYGAFGFPLNARFLGYGLVTEMNQIRWKHDRALFNPSFHRQSLVSYMDEFNARADILIERLRSLADGKKIVTLLDELNHATLDIIASIGFGFHIDSINDPNRKLASYLADGLQFTEKAITNQLTNLNPFNWRETNYFKESLKKLREIGRQLILRRIDAMKQALYVKNDFLTGLFKNEFEVNENKYDIERMIDQFLTFLFAGHETTANTLSFCLYELVRNSDCLKKLRDEFDCVLGSRNTIQYDDLKELKYAQCVLKETLRLWPVAPVIDRTTNCDDFKINEYHIPNDTWIHLGPFYSGRSRKLYSNPLKFEPERFSNELNDENLGPRNCIGQNFAQIEAKVFMAKIIKNFELTLVENQNFKSRLAATLKPTDGIKCTILIRN